MCIRERCTGRSECVNVRGLCIGMTSHESDPVILIVDCDHENIRLVGCTRDQAYRRNGND